MMAVEQYPGVSTQIIDSQGNLINPAKEDGNLEAIKDNFNVLLSTRAADITLKNGSQKTQIVDGAVNTIPSIDVHTRGLAVYDVSQISEATRNGKTFSIIVAESLSGNEVDTLLFKTGAAQVWIHRVAVGSYDSNGDCVARLYTSPSVSSNGASATIQKNLIGSSTGSLSSLYTGPSISSRGNIFKLWSGGVRDYGGGSVNVNEFGSIIIQPNTTVLFTLSGESGGWGSYNTGWIYVEWSEV
jgi:hypothetical protein